MYVRPAKSGTPNSVIDQIKRAAVVVSGGRNKQEWAARTRNREAAEAAAGKDKN